MISSSGKQKSSGPNSNPVKILTLGKNGIPQRSSYVFDTSFSTGQFPSVSKLTKIMPIRKKQSKVDYTSYRQICLLCNIAKIIEKRMPKRLSNFQDINSLVVIYF